MHFSKYTSFKSLFTKSSQYLCVYACLSLRLSLCMCVADVCRRVAGARACVCVCLCVYGYIGMHVCSFFVSRIQIKKRIDIQDFYISYTICSLTIYSYVYESSRTSRFFFA